MDFEFSAEQEELRSTVRRFLVDRAPLRPYVRDQLDDNRGTTVAVWKGLADLGATGLLVPEQYGGADLGMVEMGVVLEEMGRLVHPGPFRSSAVGAVSAVLLGGSPDDRSDLLPRLASGDVVGTVALDGAITAAPAGSAWSLSGLVPRVGDGAAAHVLVAAATTATGVGLFAVNTDEPGIEIAPADTVDGTTKFATVRLDGAAARRLGSGDARPGDVVGEVADRLAVAHAVDGLGAAEAALELTVTYAKERVQFERPIGSFQAVQHLCADMLQWVELARAGSYYALWALDGADAAERHRAATMALAYASDTLHRVGAAAIQVLGGIGFTWEHDAHLFYKRLLTLQQTGGGGPAQYEELAAIVLD